MGGVAMKDSEFIEAVDALYKCASSAGRNTKPTGIEAIVCQDIADRQALGINKYGTTLADNPLELKEWLEHQYLELLDAALYCKRAIVQIENTEQK
jgi:hypothetical protein